VTHLLDENQRQDVSAEERGSNCHSNIQHLGKDLQDNEQTNIEHECKRIKLSVTDSSDDLSEIEDAVKMSEECSETDDELPIVHSNNHTYSHNLSIVMFLLLEKFQNMSTVQKHTKIRNEGQKNYLHNVERMRLKYTKAKKCKVYFCYDVN
jgi:hypothetical protein